MCQWLFGQHERRGCCGGSEGDTLKEIGWKGGGGREGYLVGWVLNWQWRCRYSSSSSSGWCHWGLERDLRVNRWGVEWLKFDKKYLVNIPLSPYIAWEADRATAQALTESAISILRITMLSLCAGIHRYYLLR